MEDQMQTHLKNIVRILKEVGEQEKATYLDVRISHSDRGAKNRGQKRGMRTRSQTVKSSRCILWSTCWNKK